MSDRRHAAGAALSPTPNHPPTTDLPPTPALSITAGGPVDDAAAAARLHRRQLSDSFLATLGEPFLRVLYRRIALDPASTLLIARRDGQIVGFIAGTLDTGRFYRTFVRRDGGWAGLAAAPRLLRHPWATLETLRYGGGGHATDTPGAELPPAELLSLAVDPTARRGGVGAALIRALQADLRDRGLAGMRVTVAADNDAAITAYRRCDFRPATTVEVHRGRRSEVLVWG